MRGVRRFLRQWQNVIGLLLVGAMVYVAIDVPRLAPPDPGKPESYHVVGRATDRLPRRRAKSRRGARSGELDVRHTVLWGTRAALRFGLTVTVLTAVFGILVGAISGCGRLVQRRGDAHHRRDAGFSVIAGVVLFEQIVVRPLVGEVRPTRSMCSSIRWTDPLMAALIAGF